MRTLFLLIYGTVGSVTFSTPLLKTVRHHRLWDSTAFSRALSRTTSTISGRAVAYHLLPVH